MKKTPGEQRARNKQKSLFLIVALGSALCLELACDTLKAKSEGLSTAPLSELKELAGKGNAEAQYLLGTRLMKGQGVLQDTQSGIDCLKKSVAQKYGPAITSLGEAYEDGVGVKEDFNEAIRLYQLAADMHEPEGEFKLGFLCTVDRKSGGLQDQAKGIKLLRQASQDGSAAAANLLGKLYWTGKCRQVGRDEKEAVRWFERGEALGGELNLLLVEAYYTGRGTARDLRRALICYSGHLSSPEAKRWHKLLSGSQTVSNQQLEQARRWMVAELNHLDRSNIREMDLFNRK